MELIPLLIIVLGIVSSIAGSKKNKEQEGKRNIDTSKLDRRQNSAPRKRQPDRETTANEQKGFFQTLQEAFDEEFNTENTKQHRERKTESAQPAAGANREVTSRSRSERQTAERPARETIQKARERAAETTKEEYDRRFGKAEKPMSDIADEVRHLSGDDSTKMPKRSTKKPERKMSSDDLAFDSKSFVNGIIMSEILGKPKSKQKSRRKLG
ncbi:hypothetical protein BN1048_00749 [Jeotgalicoccus saudimassiliensis]|uniref:Uncharacterized protein n=1 Tax=Jeotgalicoccus saudimassiliensis TaxID=1461582 RepID=A0A078M126_9STAP|nr:hypothetical protein [Jeotgalicoccus saudimassiliensis]CDZ99969.1 hypothetical protein BN1048_00749 [Jeotgalicoccus saudimassiliensis]